MCTVSVKVNETLLRDIRPELSTTAAVRKWVQQQIDMRIQQMEAERDRNVLQEDLWLSIDHDKELSLKPSVIAADDTGSVDLETFRADLHNMVDEIYDKH